jgi:hypothetical protein
MGKWTMANGSALCRHKKTSLNPLTPNLGYIIFKDSARTSKRTLHFTVTKINCLILFKKVFAVYTENYTTLINAKCIFTDW